MDIHAVDSLPRELDKASLPEYVVEPPDTINIEATDALPDQPLSGEKLVRPDGTVSLGYYGDLHVAGRTLAEIEYRIEERLKHYVSSPRVHVDVAEYKSKVYYVAGQVKKPGRQSLTGNETVLDAVMLSGGLTDYADYCRIQLVRPRPTHGCDLILPVDWNAIVNHGDTTTNYQIMAGDRIVAHASPGFEASIWVANLIKPLERLWSSFAFIRLTLPVD